jgi:hypothetical protein
MQLKCLPTNLILIYENDNIIVLTSKRFVHECILFSLHCYNVN